MKIYTALVTPFYEDGKINFDMFRRLIEKQIADKSDGIIIAGTTGEAPTLSFDEKESLFLYASKIINGRIKTIFGIGSNSTSDTVEFLKKIDYIDSDGYLVLVPYYNIPSQEGIIRHFEKIANNTKRDILIYDIPKRTGVSLEFETIKKLSMIPNIKGIKEASHNYELMEQINSIAFFSLFLGSDDLINYAYIKKYDGIISVASNYYLDDIRKMIKTNDLNLQNFFAEMSKEKNPSFIKALLNAKGFDVGKTRLPLLLTDEKTVSKYINRE